MSTSFDLLTAFGCMIIGALVTLGVLFLRIVVSAWRAERREDEND